MWQARLVGMIGCNKEDLHFAVGAAAPVTAKNLDAPGERDRG